MEPHETTTSHAISTADRQKMLRTLLAVAIVLAASVGGALWFKHRAETRRLRAAAVALLPDLPALDMQNAASIELFELAEKAARERPLSDEMVGTIGMIFHAYQFFEEAAKCYDLARNQDPDDFRWAYLQGHVEEANYRMPRAQALLERACQLQPESADAWAALGEVLLKSHKRTEAEDAYRKALSIQSPHPLASLGMARLQMVQENWKGVVDVLLPVLDTYPRLSQVHQLLARAYEELGQPEETARHTILGEYGHAADSDLLNKVFSLAVPPIAQGGDAERGLALLSIKCNKCHTHERIYATDQPPAWWAKTVRRMQRIAGWAWLSDDEAADVVAFLSQPVEVRGTQAPSAAAKEAAP